MPIPEPGLYRPSNLTKQQRQENLAAIYGVDMPNQFSESDIERLRQILAEHDQEHKPVTTIDLNNPPRQPYRFQKFPMLVYNHAASQPAHDKEVGFVRGNVAGTEIVHVYARIVSKTVNSEHELEHALSSGWSEQAPEFSDEEPEPVMLEEEPIEKPRKRNHAA